MGRRKIWIVLIVVLLLIAGGGYAAYTRYSALAEAPPEPVLQTTTVTQGDIVITANGSGNLLPAAELELAFQTSGLVAEVLVETGDQVEVGDLLARLDTTDLERAVTQAEIALRQAEIRLEEVQEPPSEATIQRAQDAVDQAAAALYLAQISYDGTQNSVLVNETLGDAQAAYEVALERYTYWLDEYNKGDADYWFVENAQEKLDKEALTLARVQQQIDEQVQSATNGLADAADRYSQAQSDLEELLAGPGDLNIESLQLDVQTARMSLTVAQENLANAEMRSPFEGTITAVNTQVGDTVGETMAVVTLADLATPLVRFWVEETDLMSVALGNSVNVVFEALPDYVFAGEIVRVDPALVTVDGTSAVQVWASVALASHPVNLLSGMTAEVEIIAGEARGVLLVPVQALRELSPDQYAVFVVGPDGELEMRVVEVGLMDFVNAEITSGLELGEIVSTGVEQSAETEATLEEEPMPMPGIRMFGG